MSWLCRASRHLVSNTWGSEAKAAEPTSLTATRSPVSHHRQRRTTDDKGAGLHATPRAAYQLSQIELGGRYTGEAVPQAGTVVWKEKEKRWTMIYRFGYIREKSLRQGNEKTRRNAEL